MTPPLPLVSRFHPLTHLLLRALQHTLKRLHPRPQRLLPLVCPRRGEPELSLGTFRLCSLRLPQTLRFSIVSSTLPLALRTELVGLNTGVAEDVELGLQLYGLLSLAGRVTLSIPRTLLRGLQDGLTGTADVLLLLLVRATSCSTATE